jgi:ABC-type dipeptide/oligopeptide/nickel transport system permease subunit
MEFAKSDRRAVRKVNFIGNRLFWSIQVRDQGCVIALRRPYFSLHLLLATATSGLIMLAVLGFNAMGDAGRDVLAPAMLNRMSEGRTT